MTNRGSTAVPERQHYTVAPERSAILIEVTTSLGPLSFGAAGLEGFVTAAARDGAFDLTVNASAHLELQVRNLTSGNPAYDGELQRHIDARRYPAAYVDLHLARGPDSSSSYLVAGEVMVRGVTRLIEGRVVAEFPAPDLVLVRGTTTLDIRLFEVPPPTAFLLEDRTGGEGLAAIAGAARWVRLVGVPAPLHSHAQCGKGLANPPPGEVVKRNGYGSGR